jgi:hypothetical protein
MGEERREKGSRRRAIGNGRWETVVRRQMRGDGRRWETGEEFCRRQTEVGGWLTGDRKREKRKGGMRMKKRKGKTDEKRENREVKCEKLEWRMEKAQGEKKRENKKGAEKGSR